MSASHPLAGASVRLDGATGGLGREIGTEMARRGLCSRSCPRSAECSAVSPDGTELPAAMDLVRLAILRRTYTQSHIDYVIEVVTHVASQASSLRGQRIVDEPPALRHFTARFEPVS